MSQVKGNKLLPIITLQDIFGQNFILNPRASYSDFGWLPKNHEKLDFLTGAPITVTGNMPVICSISVATDDVISLLEQVKLEVAPVRHIYHSERDYRELLALLSKHKKKLVVSHPHPPSEINEEEYWLPPQLVGFLNNKANLARLVPIEHIPRRMIIHPGEISKAVKVFEKLPLVIKAATEQPNGGGYDVIICITKKDLDNASSYFSTCSTVVVEEYLEISKSYNLQFAKTIDGQIIYLGSSEQITTPAGIYLGNWMTKNNELPVFLVELGRSIMETACSFGFHGVGGFDIVISKDNRVLAIDLNFRLNGSTTALLLQESIFKVHNTTVFLFRNWDANLSWDTFFAICQEAVEKLSLIPLALYNPLASTTSGSLCCLSGILVGTSKEDILKKDTCLLNLFAGNRLR